MMKTDRFPVTVSEEGVSAKIRKFSQIKNGKTYPVFIAEYFLLGKRKQEWRSSFDEAKIAALNACRLISRGEQVSLSLANGERLEYMRANEAVTPLGVKLDVAAHEYANAMTLLDGRATIMEACRDWVKRNAVVLPKITVADAGKLLVSQAVTDGKSTDRQKQLSAALDRLAGSFSVQVHTVTPNLLGTTDLKRSQSAACRNGCAKRIEPDDSRQKLTGGRKHFTKRRSVNQKPNARRTQDFNEQIAKICFKKLLENFCERSELLSSKCE